MVVTTNLYLQKKFSDYIVACEVELEEHGNRVIDAHIILCNIASSEYELELYRKCIKTCHRVLDLSPNCIRAHFLQLKSLVKIGKEDLCIKLSEIILNDASGRFVLEDVNIILQIQDFVESVKFKNGCQVSNARDGNESALLKAPSDNRPADVIAIKQSLDSKCIPRKVESTLSSENLELDTFSRVMDSTDLKYLSSRYSTAGGDDTLCNEPVQKTLTEIKRPSTLSANSNTVLSHSIGSQNSPIECTRNILLSKVQSDFTSGPTKKGKSLGESNISAAAVIKEAHSRPAAVVTLQQVLSNFDTEGNVEVQRAPESVSASVAKEATVSSRSAIPLLPSPSSKGALYVDDSPSPSTIAAVSSATTGPRGSTSQQKKSRKPAAKNVVAPFVPSSTSSSTTLTTNFPALSSPLSLTSTSLSTSSSCSSTSLIGLPTDSISKPHLEGYLSNCLTNEDALVTRTLLQSVRSNLCCAYGEDIVDDMIAYGYLKVNTGD
jgi:Flp pilus assembly protein TadG